MTKHKEAQSNHYPWERVLEGKIAKPPTLPQPHDILNVCQHSDCWI